MTADEIEPRRMTNGEEADAYGSWRHLLVWGRGERAAVKRRTNRRERQQRRRDAGRTLREETP